MPSMRPGWLRGLRRRGGVFLAAFSLAFAVSGLASPAMAEEPSWELPQPPVDLRHLLLLPGEAAWVFYTPGSLDRAAHVQEWLRTLATEHAKWSGSTAPLSALVLNREEWEGAGLARPYGVPLGLGGGSVALPAEGDSGTVAGWKALLGGHLPPLAGSPLRGSPEEASSLLAADLLGRLEAARELQAVGPIQAQEPWVRDLVGAMVARWALRGEPQTVSYMQRLCDELAATAAGAPGRPEAAVDLAGRLGDHRAFAAAHSLAGSERRPLSRLLELQKRGGGVLHGGLLLGRYPELSSLASPPGR